MSEKYNDLIARAKAAETLLRQKFWHEHAPNSQVGLYEQKRKDLPGNGALSVHVLEQSPELVKEMVNDGLLALYICYHGRGNSVAGVNESNDDFDIPATYLSGGISAFELQTRGKSVATINQILDQISRVPWVIVQIPDNLLTGDISSHRCRELLERLEQNCKQRGTTYCRQHLELGNKDQNYTNFLLFQADRIITKSKSNPDQ